MLTAAIRSLPIWRLRLLMAVLVAGAVTGATSAMAQTETPAKKAAEARSPTTRGPVVASGPRWKDLSQQQQVALAPLSMTWDGLDDPRKRKWLAMAKNYPKLSPTEQIKMQERMTEWTELSAQQRIRARLNFAETKELTPEQKEERWLAYQALSREEKRALAKSAAKTPAGAAPAVKPVPHNRLATVPAGRPTGGGAALVAPTQGAHVLGSASAPKINRHTLLPKLPAASAAKQP